MKFSPSSWFFFLMVALIHFAGIAFAISTSTETPQKTIIEPSIQGVLIAPEKQEVQPVEKPKLKPPPKLKPKKTNQKPLPKAPRSERAVKAEPEPIPEPQPESEPQVEESEPAPVIPPSSEAHELQNPAPAYPQLSKKLKEEGIVTLKVLVKANGSVADVEILKSSGYKRLDDAAKKAFKRWHFSPATQAGVAIDYWYEINFDFSLKKTRR